MKSLKYTLGIGLMLAVSTPAQADIKQQLQKQGFVFVKSVPAPAGMTGWVGHQDQYSNTIFISKDNQYYIKGELFDAKGKNLSEEQIETHMKKAILDDVWKSLEQSTWIQDGKKNAPRIVYVFSDPNCPYCQKFWQNARPWVESGKVQLRHIQVGVIREESRAQVATLLMAKDPEALFHQMNMSKGKHNLQAARIIPANIAQKIEANQSLMDKYGFFSTPAMLWKNKQGEFKSTQGLPSNLQEMFEQ